MLILTRMRGEVVMIGDDISVVVLGIQGSMFRLGFAAPDGVPVHREEVYIRILREQEERAEALLQGDAD